eukprot:m51a1_g8896 hypothetical protein (83) ;mRNA; r:702145-702393
MDMNVQTMECRKLFCEALTNRDIRLEEKQQALVALQAALAKAENDNEKLQKTLVKEAEAACQKLDKMMADKALRLQQTMSCS